MLKFFLVQISFITVLNILRHNVRVLGKQAIFCIKSYEIRRVLMT